MCKPVAPSFVPVLVAALAFLMGPGLSQAPSRSGYREPPEAILRACLAPAAPSVSLSPRRSWLVLVQREAMPWLEVVAAPHLKLAGSRVDPVRLTSPQSTRTMSITLRALGSDDQQVIDVPAGHWSGPIWSADDRAIALLHHGRAGTELWVADPVGETPRRVDGVRLNGMLGSAVRWLPDQRRLLIRRALDGAPPPRPRVPSGPRVQESKAGVNAQVRTFQDLLRNEHDAALFEHYGTSQLAIVDVASRTVTDIGKPGMYSEASVSPDGTLLLVEEIHRPFSFLVTWGSFPRKTSLWSIAGEVLRNMHSHPLRESVPIGGVPVGPRSVDWLPARAHALVWTEALDGGDPRREVAHRDRVVLLAGVDAEPTTWFETEYRSWRVSCGGDGHTALAYEVDRKTWRQRVTAYDAQDVALPGRVVYERSLFDAYGDPGRPVSERLQDGRSMLRMRDASLFLSGTGASPKGNRPFVDRWNLATGEKQRLFRCAEGRAETFVGFLDEAGSRLLVRSESRSESPVLQIVDAATGKRSELLAFPDPVAELTRGISKRLVHYEREDGIPLSGTLYLPAGVEEGTKLPALIWAYPREYTSAKDAGQVRSSPNRYTRMRGSSHLFLLLAGYAVFDGASMPIVGPVRTANDTFVEQVRMNARAAVMALEQTGVIDTAKLCVAGHSYGAFMTANLLAHTDLFAAGIARSGAYNRTLTPFGFQREERTYWQAPEVYFAMSPFMHAQKIDEPLLLIHGADDNNSGTFPLQSERLFAALKGHGGKARLCMLPGESHGYRARESVLHCLAEMVDWMDAHCRD